MLLRIQSTVFSIFLGIAIIVGGFASAVNAASVRNEYLDKLHCLTSGDFPSDKYPDVHDPQKLCENLQNLMSCQVFSAVSFSAYVIMMFQIQQHYSYVRS